MMEDAGGSWKQRVTGRTYIAQQTW